MVPERYLAEIRSQSLFVTCVRGWVVSDVIGLTGSSSLKKRQARHFEIRWGGFDCEFGATGLVQQSIGKRGRTTCGGKVVPELFFIVCKNEGGAKEVTDRRPSSESKK